MNYKTLLALGMGLFFGTIMARARPEFSFWVTTFGAVVMLIGIFGTAARMSKKKSN